MKGTAEIIRNLAARPQGVTNGELAEATGIKSEDAGGALSARVKRGSLFKIKPEGELTHYFSSQAAADAWADGDRAPNTVLQKSTQSVIARTAVERLGAGQISSSYELAERCHCTPQLIDQALAPLVDAGKLMRVNTQRSGVAMFTYRFSSMWVPKAEDFNFLPSTATPKASISPIAPPKVKAAPSAPPAPKKAPTAPPKPASAPTQVKATASSLGYALQDSPADPPLNEATLDVIGHETVPNVFEALDLVMAINSLGEFVIDIGQGDVIKFPPHQALQLKRFLVNTQVLEEVLQ